MGRRLPGGNPVQVELLCCRYRKSRAMRKVDGGLCAQIGGAL